MSRPLFLFSLHTAAELFFVGIEWLPLLEQVKTWKREIDDAVIGGGVGSCRLVPAAGGVLLSIRRCLGVGGLGLGIRMGIGGLLRLLCGHGGVGNPHIVCRLLIVETLVESVCREQLAKPGTIQYRHGVVVDERNSVYAPLVGIAEHNVDVSFFQS